MPSDTYTLTISDVGVSTPSSLSVTNASVAANAAIAFSKLASLTNGNILVGNGSNAAASVAVTGDVALSNTGVTSIAALAFSKLAPLTSGNILVGNGSNAAASVAVTGDITVSNAGVMAIASGVIVNADVNASAAIAHSKLASMSSGNILVGSSGSVPTSVAVTGDITVSSSGVTAIANDAVTFAKMQPVSGYTLLGKPTTSSGDATEISCSSFMLESGTGFLRQSSASTARAALGLGALATQNAVTASTGGTGQTSYAIGDILYASGSTTLSKLADVATGNALLSGGIGVAPAYGKVGLTTHVSGTLPVANGGTNQTSYAVGDILFASTTTALSKLAGVSTGNVLISGGVATAPSYGKVGLATHVSGTLLVANGGTGVTTSTGSGANALATSPSLITPILGTPTSGTLTSCTGLPLTTGVTGTLPVANGGTGVTQSAYGGYYITSIVATPITTAATFVKVEGTTTTDILSNFTHSGSNRLTYTGTATRKFALYAALSFHGTSTHDYRFAFYKNGSTLLVASVISTTATGAGNLAHASSQCIVQLSNTDYIEVFATNNDNTNELTVDFMNVTVVSLI